MCVLILLWFSYKSSLVLKWLWTIVWFFFTTSKFFPWKRVWQKHQRMLYTKLSWNFLTSSEEDFETRGPWGTLLIWETSSSNNQTWAKLWLYKQVWWKLCVNSPWKRAWPFLWTNLNCLHTLFFVPTLVEIGSLILKKMTYKCCNIFAMWLLSPLTDLNLHHPRMP